MAILYGDGIHDDYEAIQELLDSGNCLVSLPMPTKNYLISKTLRVHSNQQLLLPRYAVIRMADKSNCFMLANADPEDGNCNFTVEGGIWDYNNLGQGPNPFHYPHPDHPDYIGFMFYFRNVKNFRFAHMTLKDPINFCITLDIASYFTVEDITFDFNHGNPWAENMDGVHLDGNCHYGVIRNLKGTCYDDLVALNADEGSNGPITHIEVDGIFCEDCHSAVRLLTRLNRVEHIHIHNIHGSFYQYCVGFTDLDKSIPADYIGYFNNILLENFHICKAKRLHIYHKDGMGHFPMLWFEDGVTAGNITIRNVCRQERVNDIPLVTVEKTASVGHLKLEDIIQQDSRIHIPAMVTNHGTIDTLTMENLVTDCGEVFINDGCVKNLIQK